MKTNLSLFLAIVAISAVCFDYYNTHFTPMPVPPSPPSVEVVEPPQVNQFKIELITDSWFTSKEYRTEHYEIVQEPVSGVWFYGFYDEEGNLVNLEVGQNVVISVLGLKKD